MNCDRCGAGASPCRSARRANCSNIGFHDVDYHSGEPYSNADWSSSVRAGQQRRCGRRRPHASQRRTPTRCAGARPTTSASTRRRARAGQHHDHAVQAGHADDVVILTDVRSARPAVLDRGYCTTSTTSNGCTPTMSLNGIASASSSRRRCSPRRRRRPAHRTDLLRVPATGRAVVRDEHELPLHRATDRPPRRATTLRRNRGPVRRRPHRRHQRPRPGQRGHAARPTRHHGPCLQRPMLVPRPAGAEGHEPQRRRQLLVLSLSSRAPRSLNARAPRCAVRAPSPCGAECSGSRD